ncbi:hypothetical protein [Brevibacillus formosus]|uniref:Uncharacterized protein n=1 Tax=Brevibacillus formosus TaxID=54913 RepID=A0A220MBS4_9BACL|nr:hypothetical protein [Brevibacillus formosus]ASJ52190.1 hypothetical protein BP422_00730 [Brevibacillus formosus]
MLDQFVRWLLAAILLISSISLSVVYLLHDYVAEVHAASAIPLAIVVGLSAIAVAIYERKP